MSNKNISMDVPLKTKEEIALESKARFEEIYKGLSAEFTDEAYSVDSSRGFDLTSIKAQYLVERLNNVCGLDGWSHSGAYESVEGGVIYKGILIVNDGMKGHQQEAVGFAVIKRNVGDAYKGAKTDSLSKAGSLFGLGNSVFKGLVAPPGKGSKPRTKTAPKAAVQNASTLKVDALKIARNDF